MFQDCVSTSLPLDVSIPIFTGVQVAQFSAPLGQPPILLFVGYVGHRAQQEVSVPEMCFREGRPRAMLLVLS